MDAYRINSKECGRDKNGIFHCLCGKCENMTPAELWITGRYAHEMSKTIQEEPTIFDAPKG